LRRHLRRDAGPSAAGEGCDMSTREGLSPARAETCHSLGFDANAAVPSGMRLEFRAVQSGCAYADGQFSEIHANTFIVAENEHALNRPRFHPSALFDHRLSKCRDGFATPASENLRRFGRT
jgi:hypothetical protein